MLLHKYYFNFENSLNLFERRITGFKERMTRLYLKTQIYTVKQLILNIMWTIFNIKLIYALFIFSTKLHFLLLKLIKYNILPKISVFVISLVFMFSGSF